MENPLKYMVLQPKMYFSYFLLFLLCSCSSVNKDPRFEVHYKGSIENIMEQGDLSAQFDLGDVEDIDNLYGLGAIEGLKGEILILDSWPYIAKGSALSFDIEHNFDYKATLFVYSIVKSWETFIIPEEINTYSDLEKYIPRKAYEHGIDTSKPFPFLLKGNTEEFHFHVVNWKEGDMDHTQAKHRRSGPNGKIKAQDVEILGFYSNKHHGKFIHKGTNLHMHVNSYNLKISGHLDDVKLGSNMEIKFPN